MLKCYKDLSTCDMDKVEHVVNAIYQAFDIDNNGKVGRKIYKKTYCGIFIFYFVYDRF